MYVNVLLIENQSVYVYIGSMNGKNVYVNGTWTKMKYVYVYGFGLLLITSLVNVNVT
ncbi:hypothetical protein KTT_43240 [Tengunoibacter tsumagoiensis]|uniref:Uncharacterized protein n=1 Tax=Tengunoibacter tsumagoiensis TaxID=2014871 RepID=A0A402A630_9CHLR|nr:hypothetical protein KTT_43240 [Tengunoibacter tsumagoiensis]